MKKTEPVVTFTEILARAAKDIDREIAKWVEKGEAADIPVDSVVVPLRQKRTALDTMYQFEKGTTL